MGFPQILHKKRAWLWCLLGVLFAGAAPCLAAGSAPVVRTRVVVDVIGDEASPSWLAAALEQHIALSVGAGSRIQVLNKGRTAASCSATDMPCAVAAYQAAGVEILFLGRLSGDEVHYVLYELWGKTRAGRGTIDLDDSNLAHLQQQILRAFHPVVRTGGLIDDKPLLMNPPRRTELLELSTAFWKHSRSWSKPFGLICLLLALPYLVYLVTRPGQAGRVFRLKSFLPSVLAFFVSLALVIYCDTQAPRPGPLPEHRGSWEWLFFLAGATGWTAFVLSSLRQILPRISGFDRVGHRDVVRLLRAWAVVAAQKLALMALMYAPFFIGFIAMFDHLEVPAAPLWLVIVPLIGLFARYFYLCLTDLIALALDRQLVRGEANDRNPWHIEIRDYLIGYIRRIGWDVDVADLQRIRFVPGQGGGVCSYGGGFADSRIVIPTALLEVALGQPEEVPEDTHSFSWSEWHRGLVLPEQAAAVAQTRTQAALSRIKNVGALARGKRKRTLPPDTPRRALGLPATLLGQVTPAEHGELVPLVSDNPADLLVVRELLAEHYHWTRPDPDEEYDDTDPTDRDFLFGVLVREIGRCARGENQLWTLGQGICRLPKAKRPTSWVARMWERWMSRYVVLLGDAYAALNYGRHPLVQYLEYMRTGNTQILTTRASRTELRAVSEKIFRDAHAARKDAPDESMCASYLNRVTWLSFFSRNAIPERRDLHVRNLAVALTLGAVFAGVFAGVLRALDYHPRYVEVITQEQKQLDETRPPAEKEAAPDGQEKQ